MTTNALMEGLWRALLAREAVASVALAHRQGCKCLACRASQGDQRAFAEVLYRLNEMEDRTCAPT